MNHTEINRALLAGDISSRGVLPKLEELAENEFIFEVDFGLDSLPEEPGVIMVRGGRQYGKSTWLQQQIKVTIETYGPGSALYLNGDELRDEETLLKTIRESITVFAPRAPLRRLFIDEITAIKNWQRALKILLDAGELRDILVITTGSKAADLRRGTERLPGRKGRLSRTSFIFTPITFSEFRRVCAAHIDEEHLIPAYLVSGGAPIACSALASLGHLPDYVIELVKDWIYGEFAASGRSRQMLIGALECLYRFACNPVGQSKLAREAGMANNTIAAEYVDMLADLMCVAPAFAWNENKKRMNHRRPCKYHMTNLLAAVAWHPRKPRTPREFLALPGVEQGALLEWLVAQECWRRAAIAGKEMPEVMAFWQGGEHEIDFVLGPEEFIEVKAGKADPLEFSWFPTCFPRGRLIVVSADRFETDRIIGMTVEDFLSGRAV